MASSRCQANVQQGILFLNNQDIFQLLIVPFRALLKKLTVSMLATIHQNSYVLNWSQIGTLLIY